MRLSRKDKSYEAVTYFMCVFLVVHDVNPIYLRLEWEITIFRLQRNPFRLSETFARKRV